MTSTNLTTEQAQKMNPVGDLPSVSNKKSIEALNVLLASEYTLFTKTLNFHWNVTGDRFQSLHKLLEEQYHSLLVIMDEVAERVRVLGARPLSTISEMSQKTFLKEKSHSFPSADKMLGELLRDNLLIQQQIKEFLSQEKTLRNDPGTEDFLVGVLRKHEKSSWIFKSHLN